ncbi:hypothetical protein BDA99DRAFT_559798 [Phascolomyces articulosus]|uniref:Uncharacterized protein n=1 Tax=Phascolomyces articulosus TaxID=60185 RepID=A0AAD5K0C5_9FUNG|nr:hypothetical protein BDA99DRAFT_559798 [Phascolomyces articulosus]
MSLADRIKQTSQTVISGTSMAVLAGATTGATVAILRNAPVKQYTISTALNCGVFGATFFIVRETFANHQRSKNPRFGLKDSQTRDFDDLMSSTLAGATTGGLLSAVYRGPRGVLPGALMFGTICAGMQVLYTTGNRWRQEAILGAPEVEEQKSIWDSFTMPSWSPIRMISDDEYEEMLDTRLKTLEMEVKEIERELKQAKNNDKNSKKDRS